MKDLQENIEIVQDALITCKQTKRYLNVGLMFWAVDECVNRAILALTRVLISGLFSGLLFPLNNTLGPRL